MKEQEDKKLIIKVTQRPLNAGARHGLCTASADAFSSHVLPRNADKIEAILRATKLESRAPYRCGRRKSTELRPLAASPPGFLLNLRALCAVAPSTGTILGRPRLSRSLP